MGFWWIATGLTIIASRASIRVSVRCVFPGLREPPCAELLGGETVRAETATRFQSPPPNELSLSTGMLATRSKRSPS